MSINYVPAIITAIIPVRLSTDGLYDEVERIDRILKTLPSSFDAIIVDYGTPLNRAKELRRLAGKHRCKLVREETCDQPFSVGHARDIGTQHARTPLVLYHDIDFLLSSQSYEKVLLECRLRNMPENAYAFFALPGAYLTEEFTKTYLRMHSSGDGAFADILIHDAIMKNKKAVFETNTFAISAIVANRYHLLSIGGHHKNFTGHGAEDFELMHRLCSYYQIGPRTKDYFVNTRDNSIIKYEGFRAFFALYGIDVFQRGIILSHLWHPRRTDNGYVGTTNQSRVSDVMREYDRGQVNIPPLEDLTSSEKTLVLVTPNSSPASALQQAFPALGRYHIIAETLFSAPDDVLDLVRSEGFTQVFLLNPYGNVHRLAIYRAIKAAGIRYIVYDRGAYNDSWFFDRGGFLGESLSYSREKWDQPLSDSEQKAIRSWIFDLKRSDDTLEKSGSRVGADRLRQSLGIGSRAVLFVALQRPSDTATVYFSGPCVDAHIFNSWISHLASTIDARRYVVVVKKHPLEAIRPEINNVVFTSDDAHIADLIDLAEKVVVINSGSGLIAATCGKPVICCGLSFYGHEGIAHQAKTKEELVDLCGQALTIDEGKMQRFVHYLVNQFYSFGTAEYNDVTNSSSGSIRIVRRIEFRWLRGLTAEAISLGQRSKGISLDGAIFYSFGGRSGIRRTPETPPLPEPQKKAASSKPADAKSLAISNTNAKLPPPQPKKVSVSILRRPLVPIVRAYISRYANQEALRRFDENPYSFVEALTRPTQRSIGRMLFPPRYGK